MASEPLYERSIELPAGYSFTARLQAHSIPGTLIRLLPWAVFAMLPSGGKRSRLALRVARKLSPLVKLKH